MIPYLALRTIQLGPMTIQVWGFFAAVGVIAGSLFALREAKKRGLEVRLCEDLILSVVVWNFVGARLFHVLAYDPGYYRQHPLEILEVWRGGLSSFGGFIGAALAFFYGIRKTKLPLLKTSDALCSALPLALGCGRIGCFLIHDHPGTLAYSFKWLAVNYPDGPRYDLGMLLGIFDFLLLGVFLLLLRKPRRGQVPRGMPRRDGFYFALFMTVYGPVRFLLDFLRINDARYAGLTPAQYGSIALFAAGVYLFMRIFRTGGESWMKK